MMRNEEHRRGVRASALWGSGKRGDGSRSDRLELDAALDGTRAP